MTDERLMAAFGRLDAPVAPDPVFSERLFATLASGIEWGTMPDPSLRGRVRHALGIGPMPTGRRALRLAYLVAMLGLLLALAWGAVFIASRLLTTPTPAELVRISQQAYEHPPAFTITYKMPASSDVTLSADGTGSWRVQPADEGVDSYWLWDGGDRVGHYDPTTLVWMAGTTDEVGIMGPPGALWAEYTWGTGEITAADPVRHVIPCGDATVVPDERVILGHATDHLICPDIDMQYWLDQESHLILRMKAGPNTPHWSGTTGQTNAVVEATAFTIGPQPATAFDWSGPATAYSPSNAPVSTKLRVGEALPPWQGTRTDGSTFATTAVRGPAVYLLTASWCPQNAAEWTAVSAAIRARPTLHGIIVASDLAGSLAGYATLHPTTLTLVADADGTLTTAWGISEIPTLVVVDAQGRVAGVIGGPNSPEDIGRVLDAVVAGMPVPSVERLPSASEEPAPSFEVVGTPRPRVMTPDPNMGSGERVTGMPFGGLMPEWSGPLMGGGTFESRSLRGHPSVIWVWPAANCSNCPTGELDAFAAAAKEIGDRVGIVIIAAGERTPGWTAKLFAEKGYTIPVVFDWDGSVSDPLFWLMAGFMVFDAQGRLVDERTTTPTAAELEAVATTLGPAGASPSPAPSPSG